MLQRFVFILFCFSWFAANSQDLDWVKPVANDSSSNIYAIHVTPEGDVLALVNSYYYSRNDSTYIHRSNNTLEKFNTSGEKIWTLPLRSNYNAQISGFTIDSAGNVYLIGYFEKEMQLNGDVYKVDSNAYFTAKLNADYQTVWLRKAYGLYFYEIGMMPQGKIIISSNTNVKSIDLEKSSDVSDLANFEMEYKRNRIFTAYNATNGALLWSKSYGGDSSGYFSNVYTRKVTKQGIYEMAAWSGEIDIETGPGKTIIKNNDIFFYDNLYLAKYSVDGDFLWYKVIRKDSTTKTGEITNIQMDADDEGNIFFSGGFYGKVDFDFTSKEFSIDYRNRYDWSDHYFLAKYDENLNLKWVFATKKGYTDHYITRRIQVKSTGKSVYLYGIHFPGVNIDFRNEDYKLIGNLNHFLAEYDMDGNLLTARNLGEENGFDDHSKIWYLESDVHKNIYLSGINYPKFKFDFDPSQDSVFMPDSITNSTAFLARYQTCKKPIEIIPQYQTTDCHERLTTLYAQNDHFPVKWYDENNNLLHEGITYTIPQINYATKIWAEDGCNYRDEIDITRQNRWPNIQKIYPNPASENITINLEGISTGEINIQLLNTLGQVIYTSRKEIKDGFQNVTLPLNDIREGMYFMRIWNDCIKQTEKIVVVK